jgi:hypothetical protein
MIEVILDGVIVGLSARRRSGLSSMRRVFPWVVEDVAVEVEREETALEMVVWRSARSKDLSV